MQKYAHQMPKKRALQDDRNKKAKRIVSNAASQLSSILSQLSTEQIEYLLKRSGGNVELAVNLHLEESHESKTKHTCISHQAAITSFLPTPASPCDSDMKEYAKNCSLGTCDLILSALPSAIADELLQCFLAEGRKTWKQPEIRVWEKQVTAPRLSTAYSLDSSYVALYDILYLFNRRVSHVYSYSGVERRPRAWPAVLEKVRPVIDELVNARRAPDSPEWHTSYVVCCIQEYLIGLLM